MARQRPGFHHRAGRPPRPAQPAPPSSRPPPRQPVSKASACTPCAIRRRWTGSSRACRSRPLLICLSAVSLALATLTVAVGCSLTPKYSAPQSFAVRQPVGLSGRWPIGDCCQVALDGRDALGTRSSPSVRSLLLLVSLDRKPLKILCGAVDFAPRVNVSMRDIVDGQLIASSVAPTTRQPARARSKRQAALF